MGFTDARRYIEHLEFSPSLFTLPIVLTKTVIGSTRMKGSNANFLAAVKKSRFAVYKLTMSEISLEALFESG